ncbi:MAG: sel1 repeat family protein [Bacteroidales bacterium]|nr:sel1 repeat family protein [Bacteroidales bacterium]
MKRIKHIKYVIVYMVTLMVVLFCVSCKNHTGYPIEEAPVEEILVEEVVYPEYEETDIEGQFYCTKAFKYIEDMAYKGDARCQFLLGQWYYWAYNTYWYGAKNYFKAVYWWNEAAQNEYTPAYNNLGISYRDGIGVAEDMMKYVYWVKKGAEAGEGLAMKNYGDMLRDGVYEDNSYYKRVKKYEYGYWFGDYDEIYVKSKKTILARDIEQAKYWWKKAASLGNKEAMERLQKIY